MGLEQNVKGISKSLAYNALPKLDETATAALIYAEHSMEPVLGLTGRARRAGSLVMDVLNPQREDERAVRQHFKKRIGQVALVGAFEDMNPEAADRTADTLWRSGMVDAGTIVGIRPLAHREPTKDQLRLLQSTELLHAALIKNYDVASILVAPEDPARIPGRKVRSEAIHESIYRADDEFGTWLNDRLNEHWRRDDVAPRSRTLLVASPELSPQLNGVRHEDLANGGVAVLVAARRGAKHRWQALERAPVLAPSYTLNEPGSGYDTQAEPGELELDFEVPRQERFVRAGDGQTPDRRARERQIVISEG